MPTVRAMYVSPEVTLLDDHTAAMRTPEDGLTDLPTFLARVSQVGHPNGLTVLLDGKALTLLGLPAEPPTTLLTEHPALAAARSTGWSISALRPWMTFVRHDRPTVHIGLYPWLNRRTFAFYNQLPPASVSPLYRFHRLVSVPYHGQNGGLAGLSLMRDRHSGRRPLWTPKNWRDVPPALAATEVAPLWEQRDPHGQPFEHMYDAYAQFVTAAGSLTLAGGELVHQVAKAGPYPVPGYYQVVTPPWFFSSVLPHPIGNNPQVGEPRWITAPTLQLLYEMSERHQVLDEPEILDAWTAGPSKDGRKDVDSGRVLMAWADRIQIALKQAYSNNDTVMVNAVKSLYKHGIGMLERPDARVYRPDWAHSIIANARSNQWRKIYTTWDSGNGRAPIRVEHDAVWYTSEHEDPRKEWPVGFRYGEQPGGYTCEATNEGA